MSLTTRSLLTRIVSTRRFGTVLLLLSVLVCYAPQTLGQVPVFGVDAGGLRTDDLRSILSQQTTAIDSATGTPNSRTPRLRLFRFAPGFLADPLGMQDDDSGIPGMTKLSGADLAPLAQDSGPEWIQLGMGSDNPYFDLRRPGDPGGFGYSRVNTQVSLLDSPTTALAFGVQAVTPTGAQFGGLPEGPTVVIPAFSVFHAVNDRLAVQGFVSKNVPIYDASASPLQRNLQYGVALQRPILADGPDGMRNLFFTFGALGQAAPERDYLRLVPKCDVLPGFQWHVNDNWWLSSAVLMPVGPVRTTPGQWQLTCSLQF